MLSIVLEFDSQWCIRGLEDKLTSLTYSYNTASAATLKNVLNGLVGTVASGLLPWINLASTTAASFYNVFTAPMEGVILNNRLYLGDAENVYDTRVGGAGTNRSTTETQIVKKLRDAEAILNSGKELSVVLQALEISQSSYERWGTYPRSSSRVVVLLPFGLRLRLSPHSSSTTN